MALLILDGIIMQKKLIACCIALAGLTGNAWAGTVAVITGLNSSYNVTMTTFKERAFKNTIRQKYDFSCGAAALATLLTHHYEYPIKEETIFEAMFREGDQEKIKKYGFSMADMRKFLEGRGIPANGYDIGLDKLAEIGVPAIVLISTNGYNHFVVITGISKDKVLVSDSAIGVKSYDRTQFENMWGKVVFLITARADLGEKYFNRDDYWKIVEKAPLDTATTNAALSNWRILMRGPNDF
ncbi:hypothetical protein EV683_13511 [Crenobacter luteus]|uniref:C39 family peptidase n=1 Tax=Crenobacter luteus TaxID=1452487 RepID=UPI001042B625|nr:C39 family peptidase [Crenobacter luteus]TCP08455.1 hypothetical protein EV683_13511 [Crenobacter luteus]